MVNHCGAFGVSIWQKHEPKTFADIAFADDYTREDLYDYVQYPQLTGNIILEGGYGSGKTTIAKIIATERLNDSIYVYEINGETWNSETLKTIENTVAIARTNDELAVVIINEVDRLKEKQYELRAFLEQYIGKLLVVMTTNHLGNIDGSIVDRSDVFYVRGFTPTKAVALVQPLLRLYNITIADADLKNLFTRRLVADEEELSLRQIGRVVDKLVLPNQVPQTKPTKPNLRAV